MAERLGLSQQRYFNYVSDQTEPDYETLLRICWALNTPNAVLGTEPPRAQPDEAEVLRARIAATVDIMASATLRITAAVVDVLAREHEPEGRRRPLRQGRKRGREPEGTPT